MKNTIIHNNQIILLHIGHIMELGGLDNNLVKGYSHPLPASGWL